MEKDLVDIVMEKSYIELSASEKAELSEFCSSESEFNQLKDVFLGVEMMQFESFTPKKETKDGLDSLFDDVHPKVAPIWYMSILTTVVPKEKAVHRQPLVQIAVVGLLFFLAFPFFQSEVVESAPQMARVEQKESVVIERENPTPAKADVELNTVNEDVPIVANVTTEPTVSRSVIGPSVSEPLMSAAAGASNEEMLDPNHTDLNFESADLALSQPASAEPEMLDLLTATF